MRTQRSPQQILQDLQALSYAGTSTYVTLEPAASFVCKYITIALQTLYVY
jgi:hypothetical protein